jgi:hypothetical protein
MFYKQLFKENVSQIMLYTNAVQEMLSENVGRAPQGPRGSVLTFNVGPWYGKEGKRTKIVISFSAFRYPR